MHDSTLGERLERLRGFIDGLSAREVDRLAGLGEGHVRQIEVGSKARIEVETARALATVFGVSLDWLLDGNGRAPTATSVRSAVTNARTRRAA